MPNEQTDDELEKQIVARLQSLLPFPVNPDELKTLTNNLMQLIQAREQEAERRGRIDTARKILHNGWCIPDMEVQVEDYINGLQSQQQLTQQEGKK